jgi:hypothetical protein
MPAPYGVGSMGNLTRDVGRVLLKLEIGVWYYCNSTNDVSLFSDPSPWYMQRWIM